MAESIHERVFLEERNGDRLDRKRVLQGLAILTWLRYYRGSVLEGAVLSASKNRSRFRKLAVCLSPRTFQRIAIIKRTPFRRKRIYSYIIAPSRTKRVITVLRYTRRNIGNFSEHSFLLEMNIRCVSLSLFLQKQRKETGDLYIFFYEKSLYIKSKRYNCDGSLKNRKIQNNWRKQGT